MLERLSRWSYVHRRIMLSAWLVLVIGLSVLAQTVGGEYTNDFRLPGSESQTAFDLLGERFPARSGDTGQVVFTHPQGIDAMRGDIEALLAEAEGLDGVGGIISPYDEPLGRISPDRMIAYADVQFTVEGPLVPTATLDRFKELREEAETSSGGQVDYGGFVFSFAEQEAPGGEMIGLLAAIVILLFAFGSLLAMVVPIVIALFGIGCASGLLLLAAHVIDVPFFAPQIAAMIGIGVGIDYALFIVTRYRTTLREGMSIDDALAVAARTSGRAVMFAGITVVISLCGILFMGFEFVEGVAFGGAAAVLFTMLASATLLPAILGFAGRNIDRFKVGRARREGADDGHGFWYRWSRIVQRRPAIAAILGLGILLTLAYPLTDIRLGVADDGNRSEALTIRRAYDLLSEGFGPGFNGPLLLVADLAGVPQVERNPEAIAQAVAATPGVVQVLPPQLNPEGDTAVITAFPGSSPQSVETEELVKRLRSDVLPAAIGNSGHVYVGGISAIFLDFSTSSGDRLPFVVAVIVGLSFLLLMIVFRSLLVPVKAAIMNLLSIGASYGVVVAVFQWGWLRDVFGIHATGPIESWAPMMLFVILFGLSMDYEIFLLSRIREDYLVTKDNGEAVANGLAHTARVITAAAAIMVSVFLSFVFSFEDRALKLFGLGLAVAIFIDATLVRMVLVPATMELLGDANWWLPRWLKRILPTVEVEGRGSTQPVDE